MQSWPFGNSIQETKANIIKDVSSFANANTTSEISTYDDNCLKLKWEDRRNKKEAEFTLQRDDIAVVFNSGETAGYKDFLASAYMADLKFTAQRILDVHRNKHYTIRSKAKDIYNDKQDFLDEIIKKRISSPRVAYEHGDDIFVDYTKVLFVRGQAGSGKTIAMQAITHKIAEDYIQGTTKYLLFYIDAQGRSLTRIDEAISFVVGNYSLVFQPNAVKALARNFLVVPIIDGFDELIGAGGFSDAFKSLSTLLASLERQGIIIATGRSTFYDENIFSIMANSQSGADGINYELEDVEISPWDDANIEEFINKKYEDLGLAESLKKNIDIIKNNSENEIFRKPFYLVRILEEMADGFLQINDEDVFGQKFDETWYLTKAMDSYLEREMRDKFKDRSGDPILAIDDHLSFLKELALELWWQEKRTIDNETIRIIAQMILEEKKIEAELWSIFIAKASSYSFLKTSANNKDREFESQIYFDYFFSKALNAILKENNAVNIRQFLDRSLLDESTINHYRILLNSEDEESLKKIASNIIQAANSSFVGSLSKRNAGTILAAIIQVAGLADVEIPEIDFYGVSFENTLHNVCFKRCVMREIKFYGEFDHCEFSDCSIYTAYISEDTRFNRSIFKSGTIVSRLIFKSKEFPTKTEIQGQIKLRGGQFDQEKTSIDMSREQKDLFELLKRFLDKARRRFQFDIDGDTEPSMREIFRDKCWDSLKNMLLRSGILEKHDIDRSGRRQYLFMITESPDNIITALQDPVYVSTNKINNFVNLFYEN
jgi:hypothetical protein